MMLCGFPLTLALISSVALASEPKISTLSAGDQVLIRYAVEVYHHHSEDEITITRAGDTEFVARVDSEDPLVNQDATTFRLSPEDIRGLDELLEYYRGSRSERWCSTTVSVTVTWPAAKEALVDRSCGFERQQSVLTLSELLRRTQCFYTPAATDDPAGPAIVFRGKVRKIRRQDPLEWAAAKLDDVLTSSRLRSAADARIAEFDVIDGVRGVDAEQLDLRFPRGLPPLVVGREYLITGREDTSGYRWVDSHDPPHCPGRVTIVAQLMRINGAYRQIDGLDELPIPLPTDRANERDDLHGFLVALVDCMGNSTPSKVTLRERPVPVGMLCYEALSRLVYYEAPDDQGDIDPDWPGYLQPTLSPDELRAAQRTWRVVVRERSYVRL